MRLCRGQGGWEYAQSPRGTPHSSRRRAVRGMKLKSPAGPHSLLSFPLASAPRPTPACCMLWFLCGPTRPTYSRCPADLGSHVIRRAAEPRDAPKACGCSAVIPRFPRRGWRMAELPGLSEPPPLLLGFLHQIPSRSMFHAHRGHPPPHFKIFIYLFIYGCAGSSLLCAGFL